MCLVGDTRGLVGNTRGLGSIIFQYNFHPLVLWTNPLIYEVNLYFDIYGDYPLADKIQTFYLI